MAKENLLMYYDEFCCILYFKSTIFTHSKKRMSDSLMRKANGEEKHEKGPCKGLQKGNKVGEICLNVVLLKLYSYRIDTDGNDQLLKSFFL